MDAGNIDYTAVLADLKDRREKLNAAIAAIEHILGRPASSGTEAQPGVEVTAEQQQRDAPTRVESDTFFGLSIGEGTKKFLRMKKRPATTQEICEALKEGGYLSDSKSFYSNVYATLRRRPAFVNVKGKWALTEWYPGRRLDQPKGKAAAVNGQEEASESESENKATKKGAVASPTEPVQPS